MVSHRAFFFFFCVRAGVYPPPPPILCATSFDGSSHSINTVIRTLLASGPFVRRLPPPCTRCHGNTPALLGGRGGSLSHSLSTQCSITTRKKKKTYTAEYHGSTVTVMPYITLRWSGSTSVNRALDTDYNYVETCQKWAFLEKKEKEKKMSTHRKVKHKTLDHTMQTF